MSRSGWIVRFCPSTLSIVVLLVAGTAVLVSCSGRRYAGCCSGSAAMPGSTMQWCYVIQYGPYVGEFDKSKREVLFAIFWNAHKAGSVDTRGDNLISAIHGRAISPSLTQRAVYALQPDYSLRTIDLGAEDIARVFVLLKSYEGDFRDDDVWKSQVAPQLRVVEPPASPGVQD